MPISIRDDRYPEPDRELITRIFSNDGPPWILHPRYYLTLESLKTIVTNNIADNLYLFNLNDETYHFIGKNIKFIARSNITLGLECLSLQTVKKIMLKLPPNLVKLGIANLEDDVLKCIFNTLTNRLAEVNSQKYQPDSIKSAFITVYCGKNISREYREKFAVYNSLNPYNYNLPNVAEKILSPLARVKKSHSIVSHKRTFSDINPSTSTTNIYASMLPAHSKKQQRLIELARTSVIRPMTPMPFFEKKRLVPENQRSYSAPQPQAFFQGLAPSSATESNFNLSEQRFQLSQLQFRSVFD